MKRLIIVLAALIVGLLSARAQNQLFEEEPYRSETSASVRPGMRYKEYKNLYDTRNYYPDLDDYYSPSSAGWASAFVPGLGQAVNGEWGRAMGFFAGNFVMSTILVSSLAADAVYAIGNTAADDFDTGDGVSFVSLVALLGQAALYVWNIYDAVHVAKVKCMYDRDIRSQLSGLDVKVEPFLSCAPTMVSEKARPTAGFSLKVSF
ncbi:MAG: hypothetical protein IKW89_13285 [Bacteroidales bacterium]|nr:hypothetical protein [Bacteroidales bacterium]